MTFEVTVSTVIQQLQQQMAILKKKFLRNETFGQKYIVRWTMHQHSFFPASHSESTHWVPLLKLCPDIIPQWLGKNSYTVF